MHSPSPTTSNISRLRRGFTERDGLDAWFSSHCRRIPGWSQARHGRGRRRGRLREFRIYRYNPDDKANPRLDNYFVDLDKCGPMVLDALIKIKNEVDPTLAFRRSCREGICGSCAMNIDGTNTLACTLAIEDVRGPVKIYPLPHMPVIKDLVPDLSIFFAQLRGGRALAQDRSRRRRRPKGCSRAPTAPSSTAIMNASSAPAARLHVRPIGGTASAISVPRHCSRPIAGSSICAMKSAGERLDGLEDPFRLYRCHTILNCTKTCPKGLNPAKAIAEIKKLMLARRI